MNTYLEFEIDTILNFIDDGGYEDYKMYQHDKQFWATMKIIKSKLRAIDRSIAQFRLDNYFSRKNLKKEIEQQIEESDRKWRERK